MAWTEAERDGAIKALAVVCEVTDTQLSDAAKKFMVRELETQRHGYVIAALRRCARECKHKVSLAEVLERVEEEREKRAGAVDAELTLLRLDALDALIPWNSSDIPAMRRGVDAWRRERALVAPKGGASAADILREVRKRFDARAAAAGDEEKGR